MPPQRRSPLDAVVHWRDHNFVSMSFVKRTYSSSAASRARKRTKHVVETHDTDTDVEEDNVPDSVKVVPPEHARAKTPPPRPSRESSFSTPGQSHTPTKSYSGTILTELFELSPSRALNASNGVKRRMLGRTRTEISGQSFSSSASIFGSSGSFSRTQATTATDVPVDPERPEVPPPPPSPPRLPHRNSNTRTYSGPVRS